MRLYLIAGKVTDSVTHGFLPAAARLGLDVTVLTDRPADHARVRDAGAHPPWPETEIVHCDVTDYREIITHVHAANAVFSDSDHLQAPTALAAQYVGLPGKDWRAALRAKNKSLMRRHLAGLGLDRVFTIDPESPGDGGLPTAPFPLVLKPREGVASEDVFLVEDAAELAARVAQIRTRRADPLVAEEYLPGELHTLETLGDGDALTVLGSFRTALSPPPHFVEQRMDWAPPPPETGQVLTALAALGVGFGACHTEFVVHRGRARLIEVNYRTVGDHADFLLAEILQIPLFEQVLRIHLGQPLPGRLMVPGHSTARRHGTVDYVIADRSGTLTTAPGPVQREHGEVSLTYWPHRTPGDRITLARTNRDFLGTLRVVGPDAAATESAIRDFRSRQVWEIR